MKTFRNSSFDMRFLLKRQQIHLPVGPSTPPPHHGTVCWMALIWPPSPMKAQCPKQCKALSASYSQVLKYREKRVKPESFFGALTENTVMFITQNSPQGLSMIKQPRFTKSDQVSPPNTHARHLASHFCSVSQASLAKLTMQAQISFSLETLHISPTCCVHIDFKRSFALTRKTRRAQCVTHGFYSHTIKKKGEETQSIFTFSH